MIPAVYGSLSRRSAWWSGARRALYLFELAVRSARGRRDPALAWLADLNGRRGLGFPEQGHVPSSLLGGMASPSDHALAVLALVGVVPSERPGQRSAAHSPLAWLVSEERRIAARIGGAP